VGNLAGDVEKICYVEGVGGNAGPFFVVKWQKYYSRAGPTKDVAKILKRQPYRFKIVRLTPRTGF
jgi:hypothetical protein